MSNRATWLLSQVLLGTSLLFLLISIWHAWTVVAASERDIAWLLATPEERAAAEGSTNAVSSRDASEQHPERVASVPVVAKNKTPIHFVVQLNDGPPPAENREEAISPQNGIASETDAFFVDEVKVYSILNLARVSMRLSGFLFAASLMLLGISLKLQNDSGRAPHDVSGWESAPSAAAILGAAIVIAACLCTGS